MTLESLPAPNFTGADLSLRLNSGLAELRAARRFASVAALLDDRALALGTGPRPVVPGDRLQTADGFAYQVAEAAATDHNLVTAGGVKLHVLPGPDGRYNALAWGIVSDSGVTDNYAKLQNALDLMERVKGWLVVPDAPGFYGYGTILSVGHDTTLQVDGHLKNTNTTNVWAACAMAFGNYGPYAAVDGPFQADANYPIDPLAGGTRAATLQALGDAANFAPGDLVFLHDPGNGTSSFPFMQVNEVVSRSGATLTLKHPHPYDVAKSGASELRIARANTGVTISQIDGRPCKCIRNSRLIGKGQITETYSSGRQGVHVACYESLISGNGPRQRLTLRGHRPLIGNPFFASAAQYLTLSYYGSPVELAQFCCDFDLIDNEYVPDEQPNTGTPVQVNILLNGGGYGARVRGGRSVGAALSVLKDRSDVEGLEVHGATTSSFDFSAARGGSRIRNCVSVNPTAGGPGTGTGFVINEPDMLVQGNVSRGHGLRAMRVGTNAQRCQIINNDLIGVPGAPSGVDIILDQNGAASTNRYWANKTVRNTPAVSPFALATTHSGTTATTTLASTVWPPNSIHRRGVLLVEAEAHIAGTAGVKTIDLRAALGSYSGVIASRSLLAADTGLLTLRGMIYAQDSQTSLRSVMDWRQAGASVEGDTTAFTLAGGNLGNAALTISLQATLGAVTDSLTLLRWSVTSLTDQHDI